MDPARGIVATTVTAGFVFDLATTWLASISSLPSIRRLHTLPDSSIGLSLAPTVASVRNCRPFLMPPHFFQEEPGLRLVGELVHGTTLGCARALLWAASRRGHAPPIDGKLAAAQFAMQVKAGLPLQNGIQVQWGAITAPAGRHWLLNLKAIRILLDTVWDHSFSDHQRRHLHIRGLAQSLAE